MPFTNPYADAKDGSSDLSVEARGWQAGYDAGVSTPPEVPPTQASRHGGFMNAWAEGAIAGNADGRAEGWRLRPVTESSGLVVRVPGSEPEAGGETGEMAGEFAVAWKSVGDAPLRLMLGQFAPDADGGSDVWLVGRALDKACTGKGGADRLYLPICVDPPHELSGDDLNDAGYWHGDVTDSFDVAGKAAAQHALKRMPHFPGLVRYRPAGTHNFWDWLPLGQGRPEEP
ncbi:hypothetical protein ACFWFI_09460 [Streptomyces sp. NPDC060209]|uniref:hypothetical protein n=1 Tax=Streptomyces sp. NPDC060209 TaxID=3347073 RepID=UPI0036589384